MQDSSIYPVILSGGSGIRLWPYSRSNMPKQFLPLSELNGDSLFKLTVERALNIELPLGKLIVVCNKTQRFLASVALSEIENLEARCEGAQIILEPLARNTAPAIALAALSAMEDIKDEEADPLLLALPSDHLINPQEEFAKAVKKAACYAAQNRLALFGITPSCPATGFGYIEQGEAIKAGETSGGFQVNRFVEKPPLEKAEAMLRQGGYYWNAGIFLFSAKTYLDELNAHEPEIYAQCKLAWELSQQKGEVILPDFDAFAEAPKISVDYAVMERTDKAAIIPLPVSWSDLGSFEAFYQNTPGNEAGNVCFGDVLALDSHNNYLSAQSRLLAVLGVNDLVVVETPDSVLVVPRSRCQEVGALVADLENAGRNEPHDPARVPKPWGSYQVLAEGPGFKVKRIDVLPGASLSLQMHYKRSEHWVVVQGTALVTLNDETITLNKNENIYIPSQARHRLCNPAPDHLAVIEVQSGGYLGEDDIVRFADEYNRLD
ncbi:MAG: mannose-1-phosphate guanylyltransferase/mannose-6-phosphate isomerase [Desulfovibrionaceae bacterium]|nr:mannose-1-phosphate guanylyltransferase/mannose-6-phosphate isomerase [Desulfovibrionaceae bacterium]